MTEAIKLELSQEQILQILTNAASRNDITTLEGRIDKLEKKIDAIESRLTDGINKANARIDSSNWRLMVVVLILSVFLQLILQEIRG
jgi:tetrahydromethanopterin S-methyltransferase subunit G